MEDKKKRLFHRGTISFSILWLTVIFVILAVAILSPIASNENISSTVVIIVSSILGLVYLLLLFSVIFKGKKK